MYSSCHPARGLSAPRATAGAAQHATPAAAEGGATRRASSCRYHANHASHREPRSGAREGGRLGREPTTTTVDVAGERHRVDKLGRRGGLAIASIAAVTSATDPKWR